MSQFDTRDPNQERKHTFLVTVIDSGHEERAQYSVREQFLELLGLAYGEHVVIEELDDVTPDIPVLKQYQIAHDGKLGLTLVVAATKEVAR